MATCLGCGLTLDDDNNPKVLLDPTGGIVCDETTGLSIGTPTGCLNKAADGTLSVQTVPSCDAITNNGGSASGITCITGVDGIKRLFVAPDAGGRAGRFAQNISGTFLGPTVGSLTFNTGNSGDAIYHTVDGATLTNHSCARTQTNGMQLYFNIFANVSAGAKAFFSLEDSYDGSTWVARTQRLYDNTGLGARDAIIDIQSEVWIANAPGQTTKHYMRVVVTIVSGTFVVSGGIASGFAWNYVGCGEL